MLGVAKELNKIYDGVGSLESTACFQYEEGCNQCPHYLRRSRSYDSPRKCAFESIKDSIWSLMYAVDPLETIQITAARQCKE